jgi:NADH:ubiquinone oxidoreductase subunit 4 (subunit M)
MLRAYQTMMLGERRDSNIAFGSLHKSDKVALMIIALVVIVFGVYPGPLNAIAEQATKEILMLLN